jgi:glycosyltransferase involved in cell wall biosynthesis
VRIVLANKFAHLTGGADRHALLLAGALRERGHDVAFLSTESPLNVETEGVFVPLRVTHATRGRTDRANAIRVALESVWNPAAASGAADLVRRFRPDVLHVHKLYPQLSVAPVVVAARLGVPVVQTLHDFETIAANPLDQRGRAVDTTEERLSYRAVNTLTFTTRRWLQRPRVSGWVAVSRALARAHADRGIEATVIPNFAAPEPRRRPFEERSGAVYVGRLSAEKGVGDLVELARRIPDLPISVAGDGDLREMLERASTTLPNLRLLGSVPARNVPDLLAEHLVTVLPSHCDEGGPVAAVEAMASGTPVVGYDRGGLGEYIRDADAGAAVTNLDDLALAVRDLTGDRAAWAKRAAAAADAAGRRHTPAAHATALERVYETVSRTR